MNGQRPTEAGTRLPARPLNLLEAWPDVVILPSSLARGLVVTEPPYWEPLSGHHAVGSPGRAPRGARIPFRGGNRAVASPPAKGPIVSEQQPMSPSEFNQKIIEEFRGNAGRVGGMFENLPLVLLTTTGARTGKVTTTPLAYTQDGDRVLVFASNGGADRHPAWYWNISAHPRVTVEVGTGSGEVETYEATAVALQGEERDRLYAAQAERVPAFAEYQAGTSRVIPVVALERTAP